VMWGPSRHLGSLTAANWVSFDFNVAYSSCRGYSLINTLKFKKKLIGIRSGYLIMSLVVYNLQFGACCCARAIAWGAVALALVTSHG